MGKKTFRYIPARETKSCMSPQGRLHGLVPGLVPGLCGLCGLCCLCGVGGLVAWLLHGLQLEVRHGQVHLLQEVVVHLS